MAKILLEQILSDESEYLYHNLPPAWLMRDIWHFSSKIKMFTYQQEALKKIASALYAYFNDRKNLKNKYQAYGYEKQLNRACFWMATGSGKTLVLIKTIEHIKNLMSQKVIPVREIMFLFPREDLFKSFEKQVNEYNSYHGEHINLINLKDYEEAQNAPFFSNYINVYYYRSDLLREERKESILDYSNYLNNGSWYVFLDEAHRGDNEDSNLKRYVSELSQNGFLFNFSATFSDEIDIATTCFNFNLEKFTQAGYGKNLLICDSNYKFDNRQDEFSQEEKQKQVLKSFILYTLIKKSAKSGWYHNPLMITLGNSVNKSNRRTDTDLSLFCQYMLNIASGNLDEELFETAKNGLVQSFSNEKKYCFGDETITIPQKDIKAISLEKVRGYSFNSEKKGALEYYKGAEGKEIVLKIKTADSPFALIKIGDADTFIRNYLRGYEQLETYNTRQWFYNIDNPDCTINILLGSRAFYEGWDSNRPNVINLINIGSRDAKKFVPQSIGRGIRIQPNPDEMSNRQRLKPNDQNRNKYLETLFVFPTDRNSINVLFDSVKELGEKTSKKKTNIEVKLSEQVFPLFVPDIRETDKHIITRFNINSDCKERFDSVFNAMSAGTFLLQSCRSESDRWSLAQYAELKSSFVEGKKFIPSDKVYTNFDYLLSKLRNAIASKEKEVRGVRKICGPEGENGDNADIIHYKHIETDMAENAEQRLQDKINALGSVIYSGQALTSLVMEGKANYRDDGCLYWAGRNEKVPTRPEDSFALDENNPRATTVNIRKLSQHYYTPVIYAAPQSSIGFIKHIIKHPSEALFVQNLIKFIADNANKISCQWMFSKIDESWDKICLPYISVDNDYRNFYPDFIFWQKQGDKQKITFVDPKGTRHMDWQFKVDGFIRLFCVNGKFRSFDCESDKIQFDLKLVRNPNVAGQISEAYRKWWVDNNDFKWLTEFN